jgi:PAS domain-containing protein
MLEFLNAEIAFVISIITVVGLIWGPKAWPSFYSWLGTIWKAISYPIRGTERRVDELKKLQENLSKSVTDISKKIDDLAEQFQPNGGASIKDSLNRIEFKQANNENMTNFIISSLEVPVFKTDIHGMYIWASRACCTLADRDLEDLLNWGWLSCVHSADVDRVRQTWREAVEERRIFECKFRMIRPDDRTILDIYAKAAPTFFNNKIAGWVGSWEVINGG